MAKKATGPVYKLVQIGDIRPGSNQRKFIDGVEELAKLIERSNWVCPLVVTSDGEIVAGERRYRACLLLKRPSIPIEIFDGTEQEYLDRNAVENLGRREFRFIELARIFAAQRAAGRKNDEIALRTGYNTDTVSRYINSLEKLHPDIVKRLDNGDIIQTEYLLKLYTIKNKDVQLLRLNQWLGNPIESSKAPETANQSRTNPLRRKKMVQLIKVLQDSGATDETIQVAQYLAGMRQTLPHKWHLKLSPKRQTQAKASDAF